MFNVFFKSLLLVFSVRVSGAGLAFVITFLFAFMLKPEEFGLYSLAFTIVTILSVLSRFGLDQVVLKKVAIHLKSKLNRANGYLLSATFLVLFTSCIITLSILFGSEYLANEVFSKPKFTGVISMFAVLIIPMSLRYLIGESYKSYGYPVLASFLQSVVGPIAVILIALYFIIQSQLTLHNAVVSYVFGGIISFFCILIFWKKVVPNNGYDAVSVTSLFRQGLPMFLATSGSMVMAWSDILVLGVYATEADLGVYSAASRLVMILSLLLVAVASITAPKYAYHFKNGDLNSIKKIAKMSSITLFSVVSVPALFFIFYPELILTLFGKEYVAGSGILSLLAVAQYINVSFGSLGYLLTMTGREGVYRNIMLITAIINIILSIMLMKIYGPIGVAFATVFSIILWNVWSMIEVKKHLGFWALPISFKNYSKK